MELKETTVEERKQSLCSKLLHWEEVKDSVADIYDDLNLSEYDDDSDAKVYDFKMAIMNAYEMAYKIVLDAEAEYKELEGEEE